MDVVDAWGLVLQLAALLALLLVLWRHSWRPRAVAREFARQGIHGPPYKFLVGSMPEAKRLLMASRREVAAGLDVGSHDVMPLLAPFHRWVADHGRTFVYWIGPTPAILSTDLQLVKQVLGDRTGLFQKDFMIPVLKRLLGSGLILINGDDWKRHRRVVLPAFHHEKIKRMSAVTAEVTEQMMQRWRDQIQQSGDGWKAAEIDVNRAMCDLTTEIIGRVAFGTSHREADQVTFVMKEMQKLASVAMLDPPILWYLPTRRNLQVRRLDKLLSSRITAMMQARVAAKNTSCSRGYGDDLLGLLLEAWSPERQGDCDKLTTQEVIDECKTFFGAGQETTTTLLVWTLFLLAVHPQWQDKVREEVLRVFRGDAGGEVSNADVLTKLKLLHMVLLETLRLYPPIVYIQRKAASDAVLGGIKVPRGTVISIPIGMLHRDKEVWGSDADEFNPLRFENGVSRAATDPNALLSFSLGPRTCTGQSFAIIEAQIAMAMIISNFSFSLSPKYVHKPKYLLSLTPGRGMPLIFRNLDW